MTPPSGLCRAKDLRCLGSGQTRGLRALHDDRNDRVVGGKRIATDSPECLSVVHDGFCLASRDRPSKGAGDSETLDVLAHALQQGADGALGGALFESEAFEHAD